MTQRREVIIGLEGIEDHALAVRCLGGDHLDIAILWETQFGTDSEWVAVNYRIDDKPVESSVWLLGSEEGSPLSRHEAPTEIAASIIPELFNANEFVVQIVGIRETAVFHPTGLYWAVKPVLAACGQEID